MANGTPDLPGCRGSPLGRLGAQPAAVFGGKGIFGGEEKVFWGQ